MNPEVREIEIQLSGGHSASVRAGVYGPVAVHAPRSSDLLDDSRTITHVRTGMAIESGLSRGLAIAIAEQIGRDPLWDFRDLDEFNARKQALAAKLRVAKQRAATMPRKGGGVAKGTG